MGIYEFMEVTPEVRRMIYRNAPTHEIRTELHRVGQRSLREEGVQLAIDQKTSLEEILRVTQTDEGDGEQDETPAVIGEAA